MNFPEPSRWGAQPLYEDFTVRVGTWKTASRTDELVCRPHQHPLAAQQSNPVVLLHYRLPTDAGASPAGLAGTELAQFQCHIIRILYPALKVTQDWSFGTHHRTQGVDSLVRQLSLCGTIWPNSPEIAIRPSALLKDRLKIPLTAFKRRPTPQQCAWRLVKHLVYACTSRL